MDITLMGAFAGGLLTLLSPCSAMLLPAFFAFAFNNAGALLARIGLFYLGLVTTLVPLGLLAGSLGSLLTTDRDLVIRVAAGVLVLLGVLMILGVGIPGVSRAGGMQGTSSLQVYVLGTVYGFAGACTGPLLGAVLTVAAASGNALRGGLLLLIFAAGMTVPLLVLALLWDRLPGIRRLARPREIRIGSWRNAWTNVVGGVLTLGIAALLLFSEGTTALSGVLGATQQFELESRVRAWSDDIPDAVTVLLLLLAVAGVVGAGVALRRRAVARRAEENPEERPESVAPLQSGDAS